MVRKSLVPLAALAAAPASWLVLLYGGPPPRGLSAAWARRLQATDDSFVVILRFLIEVHKRKPRSARRKLDKYALLACRLL